MNKLEIAPHMLYRAAKSYVQAEDDFDYIQAILLAGSAMYICEPLLKEQGKKSQTVLGAEIIIRLREAKSKMVNNKLEIEWGAKPIKDKEKNEIRKFVRKEDRKVYNSLKHAGFFPHGIVIKRASDDLDMVDVLGDNLDFRSAAEEIIIDAIQDYNTLDFNGDFKPYNLPTEIRRVLDCIFLEDAFEDI
ncbi:hypothetical protein [Vibrio sp. V01_P9A10T6]|uniref:hypothetical protein n=1 Tax=Vibrio sp. V01_P9A10T6 TaxID=2116368 RepID=UPI000D0348E4|nr:hypothetical protein [Vibrio sp. V01_P9A10T6]PRQ64187.1 hypothetical protein BWR16_01135 [Vibrio sp. V01_P9A10T6]